MHVHCAAIFSFVTMMESWMEQLIDCGLHARMGFVASCRKLPKLLLMPNRRA